MDKPLVNRVAQSALKTIDLEKWFPQEDMIHFDLKDYLFQGLIVREKEYRQSLRELNKALYQNKTVLVYCSTDAIIPVWAYMLVASTLSDEAAEIYFGKEEEYLACYYKQLIDSKDWSEYEDGMVVVKGCGNKPVPPAAYMFLTAKLTPMVKSLMYGEACSTVPISKRSKNRDRVVS
jgi:hypothetical protein